MGLRAQGPGLGSVSRVGGFCGVGAFMDFSGVRVWVFFVELRVQGFVVEGAGMSGYSFQL